MTDRDVTLNFSSADQTAQLTLAHKYDLTFVNLVTQVKEAALAARARAKKEADEKFFRDAQATAQQLMVADEARRVAQAASLSDAPLRALADRDQAGADAGRRREREVRRRRRQARIQLQLPA